MSLKLSRFFSSPWMDRINVLQRLLSPWTNITTFWEQTSPEMRLKRIHLRGHVVHLCFIQSVVTDLCLYNWSFSFLE